MGNRRALKEMKMYDVAILPAGKGNATDILTQDNYHSKLAEMLDCDTYRWQKKDPTKAQENRTICTSTSLERTGEISTLP